MAGVTTAFPSSFKQELAQGMHCFTGPITFTATDATSTALTVVSSQANLCRGMPLTASADIPANCFIVDMPTSTTMTVFPATTTTGAGKSITANGDIFKVALIKFGAAGTYGAASINYTDITGNSDEASGSGYAAGGIALTANTTPALTTTTATWTWTTNPSWAAVTVTTIGCMFYNSSTRCSTGRAVYVGSFGGTQTVTAGTLTLVLPVNAPGTAILQIS